MFALRKRDLKSFTPDAHSVCRIPDGSTNPYLNEERAIEEFLKGIEPKYNKALSQLTADKLDAESIYALAGFTAYILSCSPAGMRIQSQLFRGVVEETGRRLAEKGEIPAPPPELGGASLIELPDSGTVKVNIDPKYPQAMGIASILSRTSSFGNFSWDILINEVANSPFFTSDFPVALERTSDPRVNQQDRALVPDCRSAHTA
jgi:hypothetical protein